MSCRCRPSYSRWTSRARASPLGTLRIGFLENTIFQSVVPSTLHILISVQQNLRLICRMDGRLGQGGQMAPQSTGFLGVAGLSSPTPLAEQG